MAQAATPRPPSPSLEKKRSFVSENTFPGDEESTSRIQSKEDDFPEGGWRAWGCVAGAILAQFCGFGYTTSFGVFQDYYTRVYLTDYPPSVISWIGSVNACIVIASGLYVGILYDRGYFRYLLYGGSFLISLSLVLLSFARQNHLHEIFLTQGVLAGIGAGLIYVPSVAVLSHYFKRKRAIAMTIVASGSSLGAVVHPLMLNNLFSSKLGFAWTIRASAGLVTGCLIISCLLLRPRLAFTRVKRPVLQSFRHFYKDRSFSALSAGVAFFTLGFFFPIFYLQLDAVKHGISKEFAFYSLVIMNACSVVGRLLPALFIQSIGVVNMVIGSAFGCSIMIFAFLGLNSAASVVLIAVFYGLMAGVFISLQAPVVAVITPDISELGMRMGVAYTFCAFGALVGPPVHGALLTEEYIWWRAALVSGIFALIGATFFAMMPSLYKMDLERRASEAGQAERPSSSSSNDSTKDADSPESAAGRPPSAGSEKA